MMKKLQSYAQGGWHQAKSGSVLYHAINGEAVAEISSSGLDFADMLTYGRRVGSNNLAQYTFHERALMLKSLGQYLLARKELFYECSKATGATRTDSWIDIEGGISTLFVFSSKGRREMPNAKVWLDGQQEMISRSGSFTAQHIYTPIQGVAIHINAFNFPCWGMLEKLAPAILAGVPVIVKPASQTAYLTELMVHHIIESAILPEGALQLICGSVGDLLNHLNCQDMVSFTGSASTGLKLKQTPTIVENATRFFMEADSLNCAILASDVTPSDIEFALFIKEVVREMTVKVGQKCTAIRRILVPENRLDDVINALKQRLDRVGIGHPDNENVQMGALASLSQRQEILTQLKRLSVDNETVYQPTLELIDGDAEKGAFIAPTVMLSRQSGDSSAHDIEVFGPVATLLPYKDEDEAIDLAAQGKGSLVGSIISNDPTIARQLTLGAAAYHGRLLILNQSCAKESTGHGSPLPHLIHGGPGRAGGSEEMGGIRGVKHYMQRTALQGSPDMLSAITNTWLKGARRHQESTHPFRKYFAELSIGDSVISDKRTISLADINAFADLSGDRFYAHMDEEAAKRNPFFEGRVAHGYFIISMAAGLFVEPEEGPILANYGLENCRFQAPVYVDDCLQVQFTCKQKNRRENENYGEVVWDTTVINQDDAVVANYDVLTIVAVK